MANKLSNEDKATALDSVMKAFAAYKKTGGNDKRQIEHYEARIKALSEDAANVILAALQQRPIGMKKTDIHKLFGRNKSIEINRVIDILVESGRAHEGIRMGIGGMLWKAKSK